MISDLLVTSGYAMGIERLQASVVFRPGLNILFGPNGCGKSTTLRIAAAYCGIDVRGHKAGWSRYPSPAKVKGEFPDAFKEFSPGGCEATVGWDGTPTLLADPTVTDVTSFSEFYYKESDSPDGFVGLARQMSLMRETPSSGEIRLEAIKRYYDALKSPPVINELDKKFVAGHNDVWQGTARKFVTYVNSLKSTGTVSVLLDEPDRSLGLVNQAALWSRFVPTLVRAGYQVLVATHSPFALAAKSANWIEYDSNYVEESRKVLKSLVAEI